LQYQVGIEYMEEGVVKINHSKYPLLLKAINSPPQELYYRGKWEDAIFDKCLAVVGTRRMTTYGKQITHKLVSEIAACGITIVSGFMYGIDACAHKAALEGGGRTIAVMPCGIEIIHPEYQEPLYKEILKNNGLIISEIKGNSLPALWTYPRRNRIVAGLSQATLVIEAGYKSGALITAELAKKFGRKLFSLPGPLTSPVSKGTNQLIKEGAEVVTEARDILASYGLVNSQSESDPLALSNLTKLEELIIKKLQQEPREIDALARLLGVCASEIGATLSLMQLRGLVYEEESKYYVNS